MGSVITVVNTLGMVWLGATSRDNREIIHTILGYAIGIAVGYAVWGL